MRKSAHIVELDSEIIGKIRKNAKDICVQSKLVKVSAEGVNRFVNSIEPSTDHWSEIFDNMSLPDNPELLLQLFFVFNTVSFCYWGHPKWSHVIDGKSLDGSELLLHCLLKYQNEDPRNLSPQKLQSLSYDEFTEIIHGGRNLKYLVKRHEMLNALGKIMINLSYNKFSDYVEISTVSSKQILHRLISDFPFFIDTATHLGNTIHFYKRAQLLAADIDHCLELFGMRPFGISDNLTACADYKLPQILRHHGVIEYDLDLSEIVDSQSQIEAGSDAEIEIRCATIVASDMISNRYGSLGVEVSSMNVNDLLWSMSQILDSTVKPYHRVKTTNY